MGGDSLPFIDPVTLRLAIIWLVGGAFAIGLAYVIYQLRRPKKPLPPVPLSWKEERFCRKCGRKIPKSAEYCPICVPRSEFSETKPLGSLYLSIGRVLAFLAGFVILVGGVANFGGATTVSMWLYAEGTGGTFGLPAEVVLVFTMQILALFAMAILCFVGHAIAWGAGLNPWKKDSLKRTVMYVLFIAIVGFLNIVEGAVLWDSVGFGHLIFQIGLFTIILSLPSLALTTLVRS